MKLGESKERKKMLERQRRAKSECTDLEQFSASNTMKDRGRRRKQ